MPDKRFYIDSKLTLQTTYKIKGKELHHLYHVMKSQIGDTIEIINGKNVLAQAQIENLSSKEAVISITSIDTSPLPKKLIFLAQALTKPFKLDLIVEKTVELDVHGIYFFPSTFSEIKTLSKNRLERLRTITISAIKQCGKLDLPPLFMLKDLYSFSSIEGQFLFGDFRKKAPLLSSSINLSPSKPIFIFIGPEKGFCDKEIDFLENTLHAKGVSLSQNILRAETASIAAVCQTSNFLQEKEIYP